MVGLRYLDASFEPQGLLYGTAWEKGHEPCYGPQLQIYYWWFYVNFTCHVCVGGGRVLQRGVAFSPTTGWVVRLSSGGQLDSNYNSFELMSPGRLTCLMNCPPTPVLQSLKAVRCVHNTTFLRDFWDWGGNAFRACQIEDPPFLLAFRIMLPKQPQGNGRVVPKIRDVKGGGGHRLLVRAWCV